MDNDTVAKKSFLNGKRLTQLQISAKKLKKICANYTTTHGVLFKNTNPSEYPNGLLYEIHYNARDLPDRIAAISIDTFSAEKVEEVAQELSAIQDSLLEISVELNKRFFAISKK